MRLTTNDLQSNRVTSSTRRSSNTGDCKSENIKIIKATWHGQVQHRRTARSSTLIPRAHLCPSSLRPLPLPKRLTQVTAESPKTATFLNVMINHEILGYPNFSSNHTWTIEMLGIPGLHNWVWASSAHQPWEGQRFGRLITGP